MFTRREILAGAAVTTAASAVPLPVVARVVPDNYPGMWFVVDPNPNKTRCIFEIYRSLLISTLGEMRKSMTSGDWTTSKWRGNSETVRYSSMLAEAVYCHALGAFDPEFFRLSAAFGRCNEIICARSGTQSRLVLSPSLGRAIGMAGQVEWRDGKVMPV